MRFKVLLEKDEDGFVIATVPSLPGCVSQGKSEAEALRNVREAISLHVTSMAQDGLPLFPNARVKSVEVVVPA